MKLKKRKKSRRMRGTRYHGYAMKKHKGKGNRGGKGMAGTGKRAGQKKSYIIRYMFPYFGKKGMKRKGRKLKEINIEDIEKNIRRFGKKTKDGYEVDLKGYKVLGGGKLKEKIIIKADSFSKSAKEKIEKAGGKILES